MKPWGSPSFVIWDICEEKSEKHYLASLPAMQTDKTPWLQLGQGTIGSKASIIRVLAGNNLLSLPSSQMTFCPGAPSSIPLLLTCQVSVHSWGSWGTEKYTSSSSYLQESGRARTWTWVFRLLIQYSFYCIVSSLFLGCSNLHEVSICTWCFHGTLGMSCFIYMVIKSTSNQASPTWLFKDKLEFPHSPS